MVAAWHDDLVEDESGNLGNKLWIGEMGPM